LDGELTRCHRHHVPLSVAVGEVRRGDTDANPHLSDECAAALLLGKRRCDVIGHYGSGGFLLLMVHTPKMGGVACCRRFQEFLEHPAEDLAAPHRSLQSFFGLASSTNETITPQSLLRIAEENLHAARTQAETR